MLKIKINLIFAITFVAIFILQSCHQWDNFTTYFNTYYNMERLKKESEEEFSYQEEKMKLRPRVIVPEININAPKERENHLPPFLTEFIITKQKRQPVKIKLDSIIIKGSKILAKHPKSNYIQKTLYLMGVSFFYQNLWLNSQIKCGELIDRFPDGKLSPDAHLLLAKNLLIQRKFEAGKIVLSRTVDIAWQLERYDILSEAFRIQAELALFQKDYDEALKPYKQAIIQSDDDVYKAKWQFDLASLVFRMHRFKLAEKLFRKVRQYSPDYVTEFESYLYQASCLSRIGKYDLAENILDDLKSDGKYEDWKSNVFAERMNIYRLKKMDDDFEKAEKYADTSFIGSPAVAAVYYERGLENFKNHNYSDARIYFGKSRSVVNPVSKNAGHYYSLLDQWNRKRASIIPKLKKIEQNRKLSKSEKQDLSKNMYEMGRVQLQLGNLDSTEYYYACSSTFSPSEDPVSARYIYTYARFLEKREPLKSDSLMQVVIDKYPLSEYGQDALHRLGYTKEFVIDTLKELYTSGVSLWKSKSYDFAILQLTKVYNFYPDNELAPKSLYTIGWMLEKDLEAFDLAYRYYKLLLELYPNSKYASDIRRTVLYTTAIENKEAIPDSLRTRQRSLYIPNYRALFTLPEIKQDKKNKPSKKSFDVMDLFNNPLDALKKVVDSIPSAGDILDKGKKMFNNATNTDSLKKFIPGVKINNPFKDLKKSDNKTKDSTKQKKEVIPPVKDKKKK